jgi:hypothetical protein
VSGVSIFDVLGWAGAVLILVAYALLTTGRWQAEQLRYQAANAIGAGALLVWAVSISAWQSALLNAVWAVVGVYGVVRLGRRRSGAPAPHVGD